MEIPFHTDTGSPFWVEWFGVRAIGRERIRTVYGVIYFLIQHSLYYHPVRCPWRFEIGRYYMAYIVCIPKSVYKVQLLALQFFIGRMSSCVPRQELGQRKIYQVSYKACSTNRWLLGL